MQYKPANWVTGFKRSPRAANVQNRDMGLFLNSSGKFEPIDDAWDSIHSGGIFISDDNKLYFRDETNKDIYINSPVDNQLALYASSGVGINTNGHPTYAYDLTVKPAVTFGGISIISDPAHWSCFRMGDALTGAGQYACYLDYNHATDTLNIGTASSTSMTIDSSGNVGIGAAPGTLLELFGTAPYLTLRNSTHENGDGGRESKIIFEGEQSGGADSTLAVIQASHDGTSDDQKGDLIFYTNDGNDNAAPNERLRIDSAGNVGIGTSEPGRAFEVSAEESIIRVSDSNSTGTATVSYMEFGSDTGTWDRHSYIGTASGANSDFYIANEETGDILFYTSDTLRQTISAAGNVGIGAAAGTLLELFGTAPYLTLRNSTHEDGDGGRESKIIFEGEQSGGEDSTLAVIQASHDGTSDDQKGDLIFYTNDGNDNAAPTERLRIDSAGNVGIGTNGPDRILHIHTTAADSNAQITIQNDAAKYYVGLAGGDSDNFNFYNTSTSANPLSIKSSNSDVQVGQGNLVIGTAGKGIDFSNQASPAAGMTSELLDRYEEGTWTPGLSDGTNNATMNGTYNSGTYTRVGNLVMVTGYVKTSLLGSVSGNVRITGLPFTCGSGNQNYTGMSTGWAEGFAMTAGTSLNGAVYAASTFIQLFVWSATTGTASFTETQWSNDGGVMMTASYRV